MGNQVGTPKKKKGGNGGLLGLMQGTNAEETCSSKLVSSMFELNSSGHHGLPSQPQLLTYLPLLGLLVVATGYQQLKIYGQDGLELFLPTRNGKESGCSAGATTSFLQPTSSGKLVLVTSDSAIQIIDLTLLQEGKSVVVAELPSSWTTCRITAIETIRHHKATQFFYVALDDGSVQVIQESSCRFSTYTIHPSDLGVVSKDKDALFVSAMACNPTDPNQLLVAYEISNVVYVWDVAKQKVLTKTVPINNDVGAVRSLAWHASGKRFVAGFDDGSLGVFRSDKQQQTIYESVGPIPSDKPQPITHVEWITTNSASPGAIVFRGGHFPKGLTVCFPQRDQRGPKEALTDLTTSKGSNFPWKTFLVPSHNESSVMSFTTSSRAIPASSTCPFTCFVLAGDPMEGCKPSVGIFPLPCVVAQPHTPKEEWIWMIDTAAPLAVPLTTTAIQSSEVLAMQVVHLTNSNGAMRDELFSTCDEPVSDQHAFHGWESPLVGGEVELIQKQISPSIQEKVDVEQCRRTTFLVTGHADNRIRIWEVLQPENGISRGILNLIHIVEIKAVLQNSISAIHFSPDARLLLVGTTAGEIGVFSFHEGFQFVFSLHVHSSDIQTFALSYQHGYIGVADAFGVVSIVHLNSQTYKLAIFDISTEEPVTVDSILIHDTYLFVGRGNGRIQVYHLEHATLLMECKAGQTLSSISMMLLIDEEGIPILPHFPKDPTSHEENVPVDSHTKALVDALLGPSSTIDSALPRTENTVSVCLEPGPLGIFLVDDVDDRAILRGFVPNDSNAQLQEAKGIVPGNVLIQINGVDISRLKKADIISVVNSLADVAKRLTYEQQVESTVPYLLCSSGRSIQIFQAIIPPTSTEGIERPVSQHIEVDAEVQVRALVVAMSVCCIPVEESMEHALIALDQSGYVYVLALPSLHLIWSAPCPTDLLAGYAFDHMHINISGSGELFLCTSFGDIARYLIFTPDMATEMAALQYMTVKTKLLSTRNKLELGAPSPELEKKNSSGFLSIFGGKDVDLNTVFVVPSIADDERKELMGDRPETKPPPTTQAAQSGLSGTMDALQQAGQNLQLRGEKLSGLEEKTEKLKNRADEFYQTMKAFNEKESKKKWYQI